MYTEELPKKKKKELFQKHFFHCLLSSEIEDSGTAYRRLACRNTAPMFAKGGVAVDRYLSIRFCQDGELE